MKRKFERDKTNGKGFVKGFLGAAVGLTIFWFLGNSIVDIFNKEYLSPKDFEKAEWVRVYNTHLDINGYLRGEKGAKRDWLGLYESEILKKNDGELQGWIEVPTFDTIPEPVWK